MENPTAEHLYVLTDEQWRKMEPFCIGRTDDPGRTGVDNRKFVEAVLWVVRTGKAWRHLPTEFGSWNNIICRYRTWAEKDVFVRLFELSATEPGMQFAVVSGRLIYLPPEQFGKFGGIEATPQTRAERAERRRQNHAKRKRAAPTSI